MAAVQSRDRPNERYIEAPLEALKHWNKPTSSPREAIGRCWGILIDNSPLDQGGALHLQEPKRQHLGHVEAGSIL